MVTQKFDLNMIPGRVKPIVHVSQYDTGLRALEISLYADTEAYAIPAGAVLTIQGTKPDYTGFSYGSISYAGNVVSVDCTDQMTACAGAVEVEIVVVLNGERIASANFVMQVKSAAFKDDTIISETDIPIIEQLPEMMEDIDSFIGRFGSPNVAETAAEMTDTDKVYVYVGSETGYEYGHWYYHDPADDTWKSGGIYQSAGVVVDRTLKVDGEAADAKAAGDAIRAVDAAVNGLTYSEANSHIAQNGNNYEWQNGGRTRIYDISIGDTVEITAGERAASVITYTENPGSVYLNVITNDTIPAGTSRTAQYVTARKLALLTEDTQGNDVSPAVFEINGISTGLVEDVEELKTTKQDALTFDSAPTEGSTNPVTSGGVYTAVESAKADAEEAATEAKNLAFGAYATPTASGSLLTLTDGADGIPAKKLTLNLVPHQSGSGDPSPENVRPISGYTAVKVYRAGKNLLENRSAQTVTQGGVTFRQESDGIHLNGTSTETIYYNLIIRNTRAPILKAGTYTMHPLAASLPSGIDLRVSDVETQSKTHFVKTSPVTFTYTEDTPIFSFLFLPSGVTFNDLVVVAQLQAGSVATDYEPYITPTEYDITIPASAGTVYGGSLEINEDGTGTLTVDTGYLAVTAASDFAETGNFAEGTNGNRCGFRVKNNPFTQGAELYCNIAKTDASVNSGNGDNWIAYTCYAYVSGGGASYFRYIFPKTVTSGAEGLQYLIDHGCEFVYALKTPQTYTLTTEQVTTLLGSNTLWMDADGTIDLTYRADTQMYIDDRIALLNANLAFIEDGTTASRAYSVGQYVLIGGQLYRVTASIASGATFTVGTNVVATTVGTELTALA